MTIKELQEYGIKRLKESNIEDTILKIKLVLTSILNRPKEHLLIHADENVEEEKVKEFFQAVEKLENKIPLEYITKKREFMKLNFYVDENVLIPRPDTEILTEEVIKKCKKGKILDLCTGSGAIAVSLAKYIPESKVTATDISKNALKIAKKNAIENKVEVTFIESDLFDNIQEREWDAIVSNPPYIETDIINTLQPEVQKEPVIALDGGSDGLDFYRKIILNAQNYLKKDGLLALEIGYNQAKDVTQLLRGQKKYSEIEVIKDLGQNDRVVLARCKNVVFK